MSNTNDPNAWHLGLRRPMGGDPLNEPVMAAIYGYEFNGDLWRLNDQGYPEPLLEPMLGRWDTKPTPRNTEEITMAVRSDPIGEC